MRGAGVQAEALKTVATLKKALYFLGILDDDDVEWMVRSGARRNVPAGTAIIKEGEATEALFFVLSGEFAVTSARARGEIARVESGEVVGEVSLVDSRPPSATVKAVTDSVVGAVPIPLLERKLSDDPGFQGRFFKSIAVALAGRLRAANSMGYRPAQGVQMNDDDDDSNEIAPELLDSLYMAGMRFADMQKRSWGRA